MSENLEPIKQVIQIDVKESGADEAQKNLGKLDNTVSNVTKKTDSLSKTQKENTDVANNSTKASKAQKAGFEDLGGGIGGTISQVKAFSKQLLLLLANPIILFLAAIVATLALVFKAFTSTNAGADKLEQIMSAVGAVVDVLRDRLLQLFNALTSFDFDGIVASFSGVGDEISKEAKRAAELTKSLQDVEDATRDLGVSRAKLNRDLAASKEIITDETASYIEKKKAIEEVKKAEEQQTSQELANAKKKLAAIKEQNSLSDSSDEALQKQADAESAVFALQQKSAEDRRAIRKTELRADNEEKARLKEIQDERNRISKERVERARQTAKELLKIEQDYQKQYLATLAEAEKNRNNLQLEIDNAISAAQDKNNEALITAREVEIQAVNDKYFRLLELAKQFGKDTNELEIAQLNEKNEINLKFDAQEKENKEKLAAEKKLIDKAEADQKKENQDRLVSQGEALLGNIQKLAGKNKQIQKAAIIAEGGVSVGKSISNTAEAVTKDLTKGAPFSAPLVALDLAVGATSVASIVKGTSQALKSVGGGTISNGGGVSSAAPTRNIAQVGFQGSSENQIGNVIAQRNKEQQPIQAFVVSQAVTDQQELDRKKILNNSF
jgi:hypothetical protein